ncbi:MAG: family NAD(P)-dependent oxidoreductase [Frankiales bacterium]|nr:family NAD(P)-dependent oxidoreductase [Frankiales bacterium]
MTGATGGIGGAIVQALHREGARLVLTGRRAELLAPLAAQVDGRVVVCDLADPGAVARLAADCSDVDVLVANAALPASGRLDSFDVPGLDAALDVNLRAPMVLTHALLPGWTARGAGHAVYVGSISGKIATSHASVYSATKFGLRGFAQGLRDELHGTGVGVSVVNPGFVRDAGMFADSGAVPPRGIGTSSPQEVAGAVVRAVVEDLGDVDVAPALVRLSAKLNGLAPELVAGLARRMGSGQTAASIAEGQRRATP